MSLVADTVNQQLDWHLGCGRGDGERPRLQISGVGGVERDQDALSSLSNLMSDIELQDMHSVRNSGHATCGQQGCREPGWKSTGHGAGIVCPAADASKRCRRPPLMNRNDERGKATRGGTETSGG